MSVGIATAVAAALVIGGCAVDTQSMTQDVTALEGFQSALDKACSTMGRRVVRLSGSCSILSLSRKELARDSHIVEYSATVQIGPDHARDIIGLHRVVREAAPWIPIATYDSLMMVHGDAWSFDGAFLDSPGSSTAAIYLAENDVDVWGIDLRWTQVPAGTTDFTFMKNWGLDTDGQDLGMALSIARTARYYSGSSFSKMLLLGWSRGAQLGYTYLSTEATHPASQHHVSGFIPVDSYLKVSPKDSKRADACARIHDAQQGTLAAYNTGTYISSIGSFAGAAGLAASQQPGSPNAFFPPQGAPFSGYTNEQVGLGVGAATYQMFFKPPTPHYHLTGGQFAARGAPASLPYIASEQRWFHVMQMAAPFESLKVILDADTITCNDGSSNLDAHLAQINVPIFYVGAAGGFGASGLYTLGLLASSDKTSLIQSATPGDDLHDYGHADIWLSQDAPSLWWQPILNWIQGHDPQHNCNAPSDY